MYAILRVSGYFHRLLLKRNTNVSPALYFQHKQCFYNVLLTGLSKTSINLWVLKGSFICNPKQRNTPHRKSCKCAKHRRLTACNALLELTSVTQIMGNNTLFFLLVTLYVSVTLLLYFSFLQESYKATTLQSEGMSSSSENYHKWWQKVHFEVSWALKAQPLCSLVHLKAWTGTKANGLITSTWSSDVS